MRAEKKRKREQVCQMNRPGKIFINERGMTLVEVLVSVFILSIGILSALLFFTSAQTVTKLAKDKTTAATHGEYILEEMRAMTTLAEITNNNWATFVSTEGLDTLADEAITVDYAVTAADPLVVNVTVNWTTSERAESINLTTELTK